jgi:hypothetical protein
MNIYISDENRWRRYSSSKYPVIIGIINTLNNEFKEVVSISNLKEDIKITKYIISVTTDLDQYVILDKNRMQYYDYLIDTLGKLSRVNYYHINL